MWKWLTSKLGGWLVRISQPQVLQIVDLRPSRALAARTADLNIGAGTNGEIPFDSEPFDTAGWHDNAVNPSRLTVPAGITLARFEARVSINLIAPANFALRLFKNGALCANGAADEKDQDDVSGMAFFKLSTGLLPVAAGDYFEIHYINGGANLANVVHGENTWFYAEGLR